MPHDPIDDTKKAYTLKEFVEVCKEELDAWLRTMDSQNDWVRQSHTWNEWLSEFIKYMSW